jgi:predicted nucleic-acid-binding Zn-ribbon protein
LNEILRASEQSGKLTWRYKQIRSCPHCGAESLFLGKSHETTNKFRMIEVKEKKEENK